MKDFLSKLPKTIDVKVTKSGNSFSISLPELNIFTESDRLENISHMVNDLLFTYFDIPKKMQSKIQYVKKGTEKSKNFLLMVDVDLARNFHAI